MAAQVQHVDAMTSQPHTPANGSAFANSQLGQTSNGSGVAARSPPSAASSGNTYLLPSSPFKRHRATGDGYKPKVLRTCGSRPACLVNASVTYCGDNHIYAFGGFDQYTDEGTKGLTYIT